jgi:hypothetical protein
MYHLRNRKWPKHSEHLTSHPTEEITYSLGDDTGHGMVRLWFCIQVTRSHTDWEMTQATGWSDRDFAFEWEDHVPPERWHRPWNGQIVILHPSKKITYKLRDDTGRGMVRL